MPLGNWGPAPLACHPSARRPSVATSIGHSRALSLGRFSGRTVCALTASCVRHKRHVWSGKMATLRNMMLVNVIIAVGGVARTSLSPFATRALASVSHHPIVRSNDYCAWWARGEASVDEARVLVTQFSVFSNLFLLAQLHKVINAPSLDDMREGKEILGMHRTRKACAM